MLIAESLLGEARQPAIALDMLREQGQPDSHAHDRGRCAPRAPGVPADPDVAGAADCRGRVVGEAEA